MNEFSLSGQDWCGISGVQEVKVLLVLDSCFVQVLLDGVCVLCESLHKSISEGGARCSSVVRAFTHDAMGRRIDPSWWTHWAISRSSQCSTIGVTKAVVCVILSGMMHIKEPLLLIEKSSPCGGSGLPLSGPLPYVWCHIAVNEMCWVRR